MRLTRRHLRTGEFDVMERRAPAADRRKRGAARRNPGRPVIFAADSGAEIDTSKGRRCIAQSGATVVSMVSGVNFETWQRSVSLEFVLNGRGNEKGQPRDCPF